MSRKESYKAKLARSSKATKWVDDLGSSDHTQYPDSIWLADLIQAKKEAYSDEKWKKASVWQKKQMLFPIIINFINNHQDCNWTEFYNELARENYNMELELFQQFCAPRVSNIYQHELNRQDRQDSIWFDTNGGEWSIVEYIVDNRFRVSVFATGDISIDVYKVKKDKSGKPLKNSHGDFEREYVDTVSSPEEIVGIENDTQLQKAIEEGKVDFTNINNRNNWFTFSIYDNKEDEYVECDEKVVDNLNQCFDFSEPIKVIDTYKKEIGISKSH